MNSTSKIINSEKEVDRLCTDKKLKGVSSFSRSASRFFGRGPKKINATSTLHDVLMINDFNRIHEIICIYNGNTKFIDSFYEHINTLIDLHAKLLLIPNANRIDLIRDKKERDSDWKKVNSAANAITFSKFNDADFKRISHKAEIRKYAEKIENMVTSENKDSEVIEKSGISSSMSKRLKRGGPVLLRELSGVSTNALIKRGLRLENTAHALNAAPASSRRKGGNMTRRKKRSN